jgi:hypothetical protein
VSKTSPKPDKTLQVRSNVEGHVNCFFRLWGSRLSYICTSWTDSE